MRVKGRHWVMLWLVLFLAVAGGVIARQTAALASARRLRELREQRATLESRRADLERRMRQASSRQVLVRKAEQALGLHLPADSELILFSVPPSPTIRRP